MNVLYLVVPAEGVEREGAEDGAVLEEAAAQLAQGDREILEHGVGLAHHVDPLQEQPWLLPAQPPAQLLHTHQQTAMLAISIHNFKRSVGFAPATQVERGFPIWDTWNHE